MSTLVNPKQLDLLDVGLVSSRVAAAARAVASACSAGAALADDTLYHLHCEHQAEEHDRDEPDRYGCGFDAAICREQGGEYTVSWKDHIKHLRSFIDDPSALNRSSAQWHLEAIEDLLEQREERDVKEKEEIDSMCDALAAEVLQPHVLEAIQREEEE